MIICIEIDVTHWAEIYNLSEVTFDGRGPTKLMVTEEEFKELLAHASRMAGRTVDFPASQFNVNGIPVEIYTPTAPVPWSGPPRHQTVVEEAITERKKSFDKKTSILRNPFNKVPPALEEGDICPGCGKSEIESQEVENCSCHIAPPCSACVDALLHCPECGWEQEEKS